MLNFYVYILRCNDGSYYVGHTDNIESRLNQHIETDKKVGSYVANRLPVELVYAESLGSRHDALEAERKLKGWSRKKKEALINGGFKAVQEFVIKYKNENDDGPVNPSTSSGRTGERAVRRK